MKLTQLLILFLFLSIKGFSQQAVLTSSGDKVTLNYLSSSGGTIRANGTTLTSDLRLKRNIKPISKSIDQILKLNPVSYDKKQNINSSDYSIKENGFIAQELRKVFPDLVKRHR